MNWEKKDKWGAGDRLCLPANENSRKCKTKWVPSRNLQDQKDCTVCPVNVLYTNSEPDNSAIVACVLPDSSLHCPYICKYIINLVITSCTCQPRFSYLQADTNNKKPILLLLENSQLILVGLIAHRISTYAVKVVLQLNSWVKTFIPFEVEISRGKSDFLWGISFNGSLALIAFCQSHLQISCRFQQGSCKMNLWLSDRLELQLPYMLKKVFRDGDGNDWKLRVCYGFIDLGTDIWLSRWWNQLSTAEQSHFMSVNNLRDHELNSFRE